MVEENAITGRWYAVHVKPRTEKKMQVMMRKQHIWNWLPVQTKVRKVQRRTIRTEFPIFPGYVLARLDEAERIEVLKTNLVASMVHILKPRPVIHQLRQIAKAVRREREIRMVPIGWAVGERVCIAHGPLKGIEGCVMERDSKATLVISVEAFGGAVAVMLSPEDCVLQKE